MQEALYDTSDQQQPRIWFQICHSKYMHHFRSKEHDLSPLNQVTGHHHDSQSRTRV